LLQSSSNTAIPIDISECTEVTNLAQLDSPQEWNLCDLYQGFEDLFQRYYQLKSEELGQKIRICDLEEFFRKSWVDALSTSVQPG
jgi:hypothetical protein